MITWPTYGTWLQGDRRGYVKDGMFMKKNEQLRQDNEYRLVKEPVRFGNDEKKIVETAIRMEAKKNQVGLAALAVCSNHVHAVVLNSEVSIEEVVSRFKNAGRVALKDIGIDGKVWAKKYDKRFCFDEASLQTRVAYVNNHNEQDT